MKQLYIIRNKIYKSFIQFFFYTTYLKNFFLFRSIFCKKIKHYLYGLGCRRNVKKNFKYAGLIIYINIKEKSKYLKKRRKNSA